MALERDLIFDNSGADAIDRFGHDGPEKVNILLVDDNRDCLMALKELLAGPDRHLVMVESGEQALRYLLAANVGMVLLDIQLSGLSGYETAALIRQRSRTRLVPIIFVTGRSKEHADVVQGYSLGAVDYIFKPVDPTVLKSKVDCFVELAKSAQSLKRQTVALGLAEKECLRSRAAYHLVRNAPIPTFVAGIAGTIVQANLLASELLGLQLDRTVGGAPTNALTPGETWQLGGAIREVAERGVTRQLLLHPRQMPGELMALTVHIAPLRNEEDRVIGVMGIGENMQAHQQALLDVERMRVELQGKCQEIANLKELVVARDVTLLRLQKDNDALKQTLRPSHENNYEANL